MISKEIPAEAEVKNILEKGIVSFAFEKKDGQTREMSGTRNIPIVKRLKPTAVPKGQGKEAPPGLVTVFDTDNLGWRSFHYDTLVYFGQTA